MADASHDLGRFYTITGPVIHGDGRGHRINIPTANLAVPPGKVPPANGIYACWAWVDGKRYKAATNVGVRPTFTPDLPAPLIEAHLLDIDRDLYGQQITLEFVEFLRPEEKYATVEVLVAQIHLDIARTSHILDELDKHTPHQPGPLATHL
jgi:riboflavin kinase/FMN adenylyltransferase